MKNNKFFLSLLLFCFFNFLGIGQTQNVFTENFTNNPYTAGIAAIDAGLPLSPNNTCSDPEYGIQPNMNGICNLFPNVTMTGNFLVVDVDDGSDRILYSRDVQNINNAGTVTITFDAVFRYAWNEDNVNFSVQITETNGSIPAPLEVALTEDQQIHNLSFTYNIQSGISNFTLVATNLGGLNSDFGVDNIIVDFTSCAPTIIAETQNENGIPTTSFCSTEDVYLDFHQSTNYNRYFVAIRQLDATGNVIDYVRFDPGWTNQQAQGPINLSQYMNYAYWINEGWAFCPGYTYEIQLALSNWCDPWEEIRLPFRVACCDDYDATFESNTIAVDSDTYIITNGFQSSYGSGPPACPTTEYWCLSEAESDDGPYVPVAQQTGSNYSFTVKKSKSYKLVRTLSTPCGEFCCVNYFHHWNNHAPIRADCSIPCEECIIGCQTPTNLSCAVDKEKPGKIILSWDAVPTAIGYQIEWIINDPDCCKTDQEISPVKRTVRSTRESIEIKPPARCWSWRVKAICKDGQSDWSEKKCMNAETPCKVIITDEEELGEGKRIIIKEGNTLSMNKSSNSPNPFQSNFNISFNSEVSENYELYLFDTQGKLVKKQQGILQKGINVIEMNDLDHLSKGIYIYQLQSGDSIHTSKVSKL